VGKFFIHIDKGRIIAIDVQPSVQYAYSTITWTKTTSDQGILYVSYAIPSSYVVWKKKNVTYLPGTLHHSLSPRPKKNERWRDEY
jgi:hypothetical protein